jgi:hypothetical protein
MRLFYNISWLLCQAQISYSSARDKWPLYIDPGFIVKEKVEKNSFRSHEFQNKFRSLWIPPGPEITCKCNLLLILLK